MSVMLKADLAGRLAAADRHRAVEPGGGDQAVGGGPEPAGGVVARPHRRRGPGRARAAASNDRTPAH